jgi:hypothetical protein
MDGFNYQITLKIFMTIKDKFNGTGKFMPLYVGLILLIVSVIFAAGSIREQQKSDHDELLKTKADIYILQISQATTDQRYLDIMASLAEIKQELRTRKNK